MRLALFYYFLFSTTIIAQQNSSSINGHVLDKVTSEPIVGATVLIDGKETATTSVSGFFEFVNISNGKHTLNIKYVGYYSEQETLNVSGEITRVKIKLDSKPIPSKTEPEISLTKHGVMFSFNANLPAEVSDTLSLTANLQFLLDKFGKFTKMFLTDSKKDRFNIEIQFPSIDDFLLWKEKTEIQQIIGHFEGIPNGHFTTNLEVLSTDELTTNEIKSEKEVSFFIRFRKRINLNKPAHIFNGLVKRFNDDSKIHSSKIIQDRRNIQFSAKFTFSSILNFLEWRKAPETKEDLDWIEESLTEDDHIEYRFEVGHLQN